MTIHPLKAHGNEKNNIFKHLNMNPDMTANMKLDKKTDTKIDMNLGMNLDMTQNMKKVNFLTINLKHQESSMIMTDQKNHQSGHKAIHMIRNISSMKSCKSESNLLKEKNINKDLEYKSTTKWKKGSLYSPSTSPTIQIRTYFSNFSKFLWNFSIKEGDFMNLKNEQKLKVSYSSFP